ncbi:MAG TPA: cation diffusion facilitator family transporter [Ignavibacteriaceae bacterium]|nr:cation diffusion facilitator family transporter [Ignavibacteriaceae bacterium]
MENIQLKKRAAIISLSIGIGMFVFKITAYLITGSAAIFSDAAESVVHVMATSMALFSIILSSKPADDSHPYGHGNIEYFSAGIEGLLIIIAAVFIIYESTLSIIKGPELQKLGVGALIITIASTVNLLLGNYLIRTGKKTNSLTLVADGKHVLTDSITSFGVIGAVLLVMITDIFILDPIIAIIVALNILFTGYKLIRESVGGLMNEANPKTFKKLSDTLIQMKKNYWIDLHELRFWQSGDKVFIDFHLILPYYFNIKQTHEEENTIEEKLQKDFSNADLKIHFDYCLPELCKFCSYEECIVRSEKKSKSFNWDIDKLTGQPIYKIFKD